MDQKAVASGVQKERLEGMQCSRQGRPHSTSQRYRYVRSYASIARGSFDFCLLPPSASMMPLYVARDRNCRAVVVLGAVCGAISKLFSLTQAHRTHSVPEILTAVHTGMLISL